MAGMSNTGILLHVYNLGSEDWEHLVWGDPARDQLGVGAKLFEYLLSAPSDQEIVTMLYDGPSRKDGKQEGTYTKNFLLTKLDKIGEFPRLQTTYEKLSAAERERFHQRINDIIIGERIDNTVEEINFSARHFGGLGIRTVIHIAAAS